MGEKGQASSGVLGSGALQGVAGSLGNVQAGAGGLAGAIGGALGGAGDVVGGVLGGGGAGDVVGGVLGGGAGNVLGGVPIGGSGEKGQANIGQQTSENFGNIGGIAGAFGTGEQTPGLQGLGNIGIGSQK